MKARKKISILGCIAFLFLSCVEQIELEIVNVESLLVVEANLTNQNIQQQVLLSRTTALEDSTIRRESNATVSIIDELGEVFDFTENSPGIYLSNTPFAAQINRDYKLELRTATGDEYTSTPQRFTEVSEIENIYASATINEEDEQGVSIFIDTETTSETGRYRYEYEETFKVIAPNWSAFEADIISRDRQDPMVALKLKEQENRICYKDSVSTAIILASTDNVGSNRLVGLPIQFIKRDNYLIEHRYSILVKQYSQNIESFEFYTILRDLSSSANFFTELQPGFVAGNLSSKNNDTENVVGFFNVSAVSEKRLFFNYTDIFLDSQLINFDFPFSCTVFSPALMGLSDQANSPLITALDLGAIIYQETADFDVIPDGFEGPYTLVPKICGDCTVLGNAQVPDFWIE